MTTRLRLPFFLLALLAIAVAMLVERGAVSAIKVAEKISFLEMPTKDDAESQGKKVFNLDAYQTEMDKAKAITSPKLQGFAIPSMQYVDGCLLFTVLLMGLALRIPPDIHAKIQGIITLVFGVLLILAAIAWILVIMGQLLVMVALLLSFPFGTIAYMFIYGGFPRAAMNAILGLLFLLKIIFGVLLLLAHQDFLKNIGLVAFVAVSFVAGLVVSFLYGLAPGILVSITDAIAGIVVTIIGAILGLILAIGSIPSIAKAVKL